MKRVVALLLSLALYIPLFVQATDKTLPPAEAKEHVGEVATVCGVAASIHYAAGSRGTPTFINLDKPYPNQVFTILIWGEDLGQVRQAGELGRQEDLCNWHYHLVSRKSRNCGEIGRSDSDPWA